MNKSEEEFEKWLSKNRKKFITKDNAVYWARKAYYAGWEKSEEILVEERYKSTRRLP